MFDITTILAVIAGFAFVFVAGALVGAGPDAPLTGMFPHSGKRDWPQGVQEMDVPHFAVEHLDALRPTAQAA